MRLASQQRSVRDELLTGHGDDGGGDVSRAEALVDGLVALEDGGVVVTTVVVRRGGGTADGSRREGDEGVLHV